MTSGCSLLIGASERTLFCIVSAVIVICNGALTPGLKPALQNSAQLVCVSFLQAGMNATARAHRWHDNVQSNQVRNTSK